jgi:carboxypeptidase PM20D1
LGRFDLPGTFTVKEDFVMLVLWIVLSVIAAIVFIVTIKTLAFKLPQESVQPMEIPGGMACAEKLAEAIRIPTVSYIDTAKTDWAAFEGFHALLQKQFPLFHAKCEKAVISGYSLVYCWPGADKSAKKPALITAHMDVVPVEAGTEKDWKHDPFGGELADGCIWGRGTLDVKIHLIASLEAAEKLIQEGYTPPRDVYFAFGHDEETGGKEGAVFIADYFKDQGIAFDFVLDEGSCVVQGALTGVSEPLALIGVGEKGYADIRIQVCGEGGHSSMPPRHTSLGLLAKALCLLENKKRKAKLIAPVREFLQIIGPAMGLVNRIILANLWIFQPLFIAVFGGTKTGNALLSTTTAVTMAKGSPAPNVIPQNSEAVVNFRILPGETGEELLQSIIKTCKGIPLELTPINLDEPSIVSPTDTEGYRIIRSVTKKIYPDAIIAPYVLLASSDARKYESVCKNIYRFTPFYIQNDEVSAMHGTNENISVENINRCVAFFTELFRLI